MYLQRILNLTFSLIFVRHTKRYIRELSNYRIRSSEKREGNIGVDSCYVGSTDRCNIIDFRCNIIDFLNSTSGVEN